MQVLLSFDVEDFINNRSILALNRILLLLKKHDFKGIFFVTGHMAEKLCSYPETLNLLSNHEIGYHSSSHSVRPTIFEYTDVPDYEVAFAESVRRESSHINPVTGKVEGKGGITVLRELFPQKNVVSFRAPGFCWTPPHLEALTKMSIKYDFSAFISSEPVQHSGITFYPRQIHFFGDEFSCKNNKTILLSLLKNKVTILLFHPNVFVNDGCWDAPYHRGNPNKLTRVKPRTLFQAKLKLIEFELVLMLLKFFQKINFVNVTSDLVEADKHPIVTKEIIEKCYEESMQWAASCFNYRPKFLLSHFFSYFNINSNSKKS